MKRPVTAVFATAAIAAIAVPLLRAQAPATIRAGWHVIRAELGEPNIWSLDQAHYLLEQRFLNNQTLSPKRPTDADLDPNAATSSRVRALQQLLSVSAGFDQRIATNNAAAQARAADNAALRGPLKLALDQAKAKVALLAETRDEIAARLVTLEKDPASYTLTPGGTPTLTIQAYAAKVGLEAERKAAEAALADANAGTAEVAAQLKSVADNRPTETVETPKPPDVKIELPKGLLEGLTQKDLPNARLSVSNVIDNYVNFQNEMIMKQVTLLRNEAGYNRDAVIVELPHSITTASQQNGEKAENYRLQVQWRLDGFLRRSDGRREYSSNQRRLIRRAEIVRCVEKAALCPAEPVGCELSFPFAPGKRELPQYTYLQEPGSGDGRRPHNDTWIAPGTLHVLDLSPRMSALNVNDQNYAQKTFGVNGVFKWLFGLGLNVSYSQQKELFEQYLTQEVYASAFGKGSRDFGWQLGPPPGTTSLAPGIRTTHAILSIPRNALAIRLLGRVCVYRRNEIPPATGDWSEPNQQSGDGRCGPARNFDLPVPGEAQSGFWITEARYTPKKPGERQVVFLRGDYFSSLTGVLVNGVPLRRAVSVARPEMTPDYGGASYATQSIRGEYEVINPDEMVLAFSAPPDYEGTPDITLVSPVRARSINDLPLDLVIQSTRFPGIALDATPKPMFALTSTPPKAPSISAVHYYGTTRELEILGTGLDKPLSFYANGVSLQFCQQRPDRAVCPLTPFSPNLSACQAEILRLTLVDSTNANRPVASKEMQSPCLPRLSVGKLVRLHQPPAPAMPVALFALDGSNFNARDVYTAKVMLPGGTLVTAQTSFASATQILVDAALSSKNAPYVTVELSVQPGSLVGANNAITIGTVAVDLVEPDPPAPSKFETVEILEKKKKAPPKPAEPKP